MDNIWQIESRKKKEWKLVCKLKREHAVPKRRKTILKLNPSFHLSRRASMSRCHCRKLQMRL